MIDDKLKDELNKIGTILAERIGEFYGRISFNFQGGYVNTNIEVSIKPK